MKSVDISITHRGTNNAINISLLFISKTTSRSVPLDSKLSIYINAVFLFRNVYLHKSYSIFVNITANLSHNFTYVYRHIKFYSLMKHEYKYTEVTVANFKADPSNKLFKN